MVDILSPPSIDPSARGDLSGTVRLVLTKFLQQVDDMLPARVISYDRETNMARVQAFINVVTTAGTRVPRAEISSIPVLQLGGGGFVLSFPIQPGNMGWIKANDRDISMFLQSYTSSDPNTQRMHSFEDALFIPDTMFQSVSINPEDEANVVLQSLDGSQRVAIWPGKIKITSDEEVIIDTPLCRITGDLVTGEDTGSGGTATFYGTIRGEQDIIAGYGDEDISLLHHTHDGVTPGGGNTGEPNPT